MVEGNGERSSESKRNGDPSGADGDGGTRIATDDGRVDLKTDDKEEETESDVGNKGEIWQRLGGEYVLCKSGYTTKGSWA